MNINYAFTEIIKRRLEAKYPQLGTDYDLAHCVGVDTSEVLVVRGGVVNNNDLVWVGRAPNVAAKLSGLREPAYHSFITAAVYNKLQEGRKDFTGRPANVGTTVMECRRRSKQNLSLNLVVEALKFLVDLT